MTTITDLSHSLQQLLTTTANRLAKESGFIRRERQLTGAGFAQTLVLGGLGQPEATRKQVHHSLTRSGTQMSLQGLDQRFNASAVVFMRCLLETALSQMMESEASRGLLPQFKGVYVTDCTQLKWAGLGIKMAVRLELQQGGLQAHLSDIERNDQKTEVIDRPLPAGALHLGDLGFFKLKRFGDWNEQGVYWLSRFKVGTRLTTLDGQPLDLKEVLKGHAPISLPVKVGSRQPVRAFLLAAPLSGAALSKRQVRLKEQARLDQRPLSQRQLDLMQWTIYLTNIPNLTFDQAFTLARTRWQIELLFKLWKSQAKVLVSRSADPLRQQVEGYAKLLGVLVAHWMLLVTGWQHDRLSAVDALHILRAYVPLLQRAFVYGSLFADVFHWLILDLEAAPPLPKRRKTPLTFQLWRDFEDNYA
jgi:Transposase DDE domain